MNNLKSLSAAVVLMLVLALPGFAGEMTTTVTATTPPPSSAVADGEMTTTVTQIALNLLQSVMSLF